MMTLKRTVQTICSSKPHKYNNYDKAPSIVSPYVEKPLVNLSKKVCPPHEKPFLENFPDTLRGRHNELSPKGSCFYIGIKQMLCSFILRQKKLA